MNCYDRGFLLYPCWVPSILCLSVCPLTWSAPHHLRLHRLRTDHSNWNSKHFTTEKPVGYWALQSLQRKGDGGVCTQHAERLCQIVFDYIVAQPTLYTLLVKSLFILFSLCSRNPVHHSPAMSSSNLFPHLHQEHLSNTSHATRLQQFVSPSFKSPPASQSPDYHSISVVNKLYSLQLVFCTLDLTMFITTMLHTYITYTY